MQPLVSSLSASDRLVQPLRKDFLYVIHERNNKHHNNLGAHPNSLLEPLLQPINTKKLKRCWPLDLQGTWGDIDGWIPYHFIVIHGIVAYLCNHHISLYIVFFLIANKWNKKTVCISLHFEAIRMVQNETKHFCRLCNIKIRNCDIK